MYLAQIATEVRKSRVKHPAQVKLDHLLFKPRRTSKTPYSLDKSKSAWLALVGIPKNQ